MKKIQEEIQIIEKAVDSNMLKGDDMKAGLRYIEVFYYFSTECEFKV